MKRQSGFTLMELLFTMMVAGILVGMALPSFRTSVQNNRLVTQADDLLGMLLYARSQAVMSNVNVIVCASNNTDTATPSCSGTNWANGYVVCKTDCSTATNVLRIEAALTGGNSLTNTSSLSTITYSPSTGAPTAGGNFYFDLCDARGASYGRAIYVYSAGQVRVSSTPGKQLDGTTALSC